MKFKSNPFRSPAICGAAVGCACFTLLNPCAQAADQLWIGSAGDHNVTTASNWVGGAPVVDQWAPFVFGSDVVDGTMNLDRWVAISSITLNSGLTHDVTIDNGPIVMGGSLVDMSSAGANLTLNAQVQQAWGDMTFNVGAGRTLTANGGVTESGWFGLHTGLTKSGDGKAVLGGASTYTLDTVINAGTLEIGGAGTLGGGSYAGAITNYGAFVHSSSADQTLAVITGPGSITQSGTSTLTLTSYGVGNSGTITVNSGTLQAPDGPWQQESHNIVVNGGTFSTSDGNSRALSWTLNGGTVSSRGDASPTFWGNIMLYDNQAVTVGGAAVSTISSHVMLGAGSEFAVGAGSTLNVTGALSNSVWATGGNGSFIKTGDGTLALSGANNYTGTTTVNAGALHFETAGTVIYTGGTITINNGSTVKFDGGAGNQYWLDGKIIAFGAGGGTLDTGTGVNIVTGAYTSGGTGLTFTTTAATTSTISGSSGLNANGNTETFDVASTSTLNLTSFVWNSGSVTKQGGGTLVMNGTNTYSGTTDVTQGTLALGASNVLPDSSHVTLGNATLDAATFTDTAGTLAIAGSATIHLGTGAALAFADSHSVSWSGSLTLTGTFVSGASLRFGSDSTGLTSGQLATISAPGLTSFALDASGYLTASVATGYTGWKIVNAPTGTPADDYDHDGVSNAVEYVLGGTKNTNDLGKLPQISTPGGNLVFTFQRDQASIDGSTAVAIEVGPDLVSWPDSYTVGADNGGSSPEVSIVKGVPTGFDTVTLTLPRGADAKKFARLVVTPAP